MILKVHSRCYANFKALFRDTSERPESLEVVGWGEPDGLFPLGYVEVKYPGDEVPKGFQTAFLTLFSEVQQ